MRRYVLPASLLALVLTAALTSAEDKPLGSEIRRPVTYDPRMATQVAPANHDPRCACHDSRTSGWTRAWQWLTYRAPIRGSFCRGIMFGSNENHPPLYSYFLPPLGVAYGVPVSPTHDAVLPPPRVRDK